MACHFLGTNNIRQFFTWMYVKVTHPLRTLIAASVLHEMTHDD